MYRVLIVDDEMLARVGIRSLLNWEEEGFCIVGEADNGEKALPLIRRLQPDIVITDYKMPIMDGVSLLLRCKEEKLPVEFIILSSYSDYEYVRSTLKNGAVDYLLKLELEPDMLLEALSKAASKREAGRRSGAGFPVQTVSESGIRHAYRQLINGSGGARTDELRAVLEQSGCPVRSIALAAFHILDARKKELSSAQFGDAVSPVSGMIRQIMQSETDAVTLSMHRDGIICCVFSCKSEADCMNIVSSAALRIRESIRQLFSYETFIGCSFVKRTLAELPAAWGEACNAMHCAELYNMGACVSASFERAAQDHLSGETLFKQINTAVDRMDYDSLHAALREMSAHLLADRQLDPQYLSALCYMLIFHLSSLKRRMEVPDPLVVEGQQALQHQIRTLSGHESAAAFVKQMDQEFRTVMAAEGDYPCIARAKNYVEEHLSENISLEDVAASVSLSANYFSKLFHKRTGEKFTVYLTNQKVNAAKAMLLSGKMTIREVAEALGFENATYFSKVFKKVTGSTPQNYQQTIQQ